MPEPCGCEIEGKSMVKICKWHSNQQSKIFRVTTFIILAKIRLLFKKTHLKELEEEIIKEVSKLIK